MSKKVHPIQYIVVPDTNSIRTNEKVFTLVSKSFKSTYEELLNECLLKLVIPDIVYRELLVQKIQDGVIEFKKSYMKSGKELGALLEEDIVRTLPEDKKFEEIVKRNFDNEIASIQNCLIFELKKSAKIFDQIIEWGIYKQAPFKKNGEGFKDALILFSLWQILEIEKDSNIAFICKDGRFLQGIERELKPRFTNLHIFEDIEYLKKYIDGIEKVSSEYLDSILDTCGNEIVEYFNTHPDMIENVDREFYRVIQSSYQRGLLSAIALSGQFKFNRPSIIRGVSAAVINIEDNKKYNFKSVLIFENSLEMQVGETWGLSGKWTAHVDVYWSANVLEGKPPKFQNIEVDIEKLFLTSITDDAS